jgi:hypothetical protein
MSTWDKIYFSICGTSFLIAFTIWINLYFESQEAKQREPDYKSLYLKANGDIKRYQDSVKLKCLCH